MPYLASHTSTVTGNESSICQLPAVCATAGTAALIAQVCSGWIPKGDGGGAEMDVARRISATSGPPRRPR